jgi:hypothetical protein
MQEDRRENAPNFTGCKGKCTEIKRTEKMYNTLENRRKNAPNFTGCKGKCTEIKKKEEKFTKIKKTEGNMNRTCTEL